jgi:hypothetical protein
MSLCLARQTLGGYGDACEADNGLNDILIEGHPESIQRYRQEEQRDPALHS